MLALLAAATMTLAIAPAEVRPAAPAVGRPVFLFSGRLGPGEIAARMHCKDAVRLQTGFEPALLFREQDKAAARARKLIDLPQGAMCLVGGSADAPGGSR